MEKKINDYSAEDIQILEGLEAVRKRPGMYIGSTGIEGLHHLIREIVDNCIDEFIMGEGTEMTVRLLPDNKIEIADDGRGIPVDIHPKTKKSTLETILTVLHAGGKFGGKAYKATGGLHGVGASVVNALSTYLKANIYRDGYEYLQEYERGKPLYEVKKVGSSNKRGTTITFSPDPEIFPIIDFDYDKILNYLRQQAYLTKKIKITLIDKRMGGAERSEEKRYSFYFENGIKSYVNYLTKNIQKKYNHIFYTSGEKNNIQAEIAFQYTQEFEVNEKSFVNNIFTVDGGTHLTGFRTALTRILNDYARKNNFIKEKDDNLSGEDVREGLTVVVSVKVNEPQFEGQTKSKLGTVEAKTAVDQIFGAALADYLEKNPQEAKVIIENSILSQKARKAAKNAKENILRKGVLEGLSLPGKLADCTSRKPEESEIFIVEGDSAGGSSKQARDRYTQAILPLKGKILNVERSRKDRILDSTEIRSLIIALGVSVAEDFDLSKLRYHKIIITCDADSDGNHIKTLILTLFYRYFKPIIEAGYLYIARPPLYQIQVGKEKKYAADENEKNEIIDKIKETRKKSGKKGKDLEVGISIQRYKGLGEMNPDQLWETTMNPEKRLLLKVSIEEADAADKIFDTLMGEEVSPRKKFIQAYAKTVQNLDI